jgi:hypothetical protein
MFNINSHKFAQNLRLLVVIANLITCSCLAVNDIILTRKCGNDVTRFSASLVTTQVRSPSECGVACASSNESCLAINVIPTTATTESGECQLLGGILPIVDCVTETTSTANGRYYERNKVSYLYFHDLTLILSGKIW